jgi:hypothetical protein
MLSEANHPIIYEEIFRFDKDDNPNFWFSYLFT